MRVMKDSTERLSLALGADVADKRIAILRNVGECGSISEAARHSGVSYKAAWQAVETLSQLAGAPLVQSAVGGSGGGGAVLTPAGEQLLQAAQWLQSARRAALAKITKGDDALAPLGLQFRSSMRNQWPAQVSQLKRRGGMVHVALELAGGMPLAALITRESAELLDLKAGMRLLALCKATALEVFAEAEDALDSGVKLASSGRQQEWVNQAVSAGDGVAETLWRGRVMRASRAAAGGEVTLQLMGGKTRTELRAVGFAGPSHGLRVGQPAVARLAHSAVVLVALDA